MCVCVCACVSKCAFVNIDSCVDIDMCVYLSVAVSTVGRAYCPGRNVVGEKREKKKTFVKKWANKIRMG